jgi:predicted Zn-dependent protease
VAFAQSATAPSAPEAPTAKQLPKGLPEIQKLIGEARYDEALAALDVLAQQSPEPAGVERLRGTALYQQDKFGPADIAFAKALEQDPDDHIATQMRGMVLFRTGQPAQAIPYLLKANTWLADENADANYVLGIAYLQTKRYDEARRSFAQMYSFPPDSASSYLLSARLLLRNEFLSVSREYANKALELDPHIPLAHGVLGEIALAENNPELAISELLKEQQSNPLNPSVYDRLGDAYLRQGKLDESQKLLNQAILLDPYSTGPLILMGKLLLKRGDDNLAASFLRRAEGMDPGNYQTHTLLGQAYRAMGRREDALKQFQAAEHVQRDKDDKP